jgi:hypothetical protein
VPDGTKNIVGNRELVDDNQNQQPNPSALTDSYSTIVQASTAAGEAESSFGDYAWFAQNAQKKTHPVREKKPNAWACTTCTGMFGSVVRICILTIHQMRRPIHKILMAARPAWTVAALTILMLRIAGRRTATRATR